MHIHCKDWDIYRGKLRRCKKTARWSDGCCDAHTISDVGLDTIENEVWEIVGLEDKRQVLVQEPYIEEGYKIKKRSLPPCE